MLQKFLFMMMPLPIFACTGGVGILVILAIAFVFSILFLYLFVQSIRKYIKTKRKFSLLGTLPFASIVVYYLTVILVGV